MGETFTTTNRARGPWRRSICDQSGANIGSGGCSGNGLSSDLTLGLGRDRREKHDWIRADVVGVRAEIAGQSERCAAVAANTSRAQPVGVRLAYRASATPIRIKNEHLRCGLSHIHREV